MVTAKVTDVLNDWWVIDAGIPLYRAGLPPDGIKPGSWVVGKIYVGVDPFDYFERLSRYHAAPALIYNWNVTKIELEITPIIELGRMKMRDLCRRGWREVNDTKAHSAGAVVDEFVLHCEREHEAPRR
jgi:hypothetical protein